jgi:hypothetical protein
MFYTTVVKVVLEESRQPLPGVNVSLFDKDRFSKDDLLGNGPTDAEGEARFRYDTTDFQDLDDSAEALRGTFPDLYAVVHAPDGSTAVSTRADAIDNLPRREILVTVPAAVASRHGWGATRS